MLQFVFMWQLKGRKWHIKPCLMELTKQGKWTATPDILPESTWVWVMDENRKQEGDETSSWALNSVQNVWPSSFTHILKTIFSYQCYIIKSFFHSILKWHHEIPVLRNLIGVVFFFVYWLQLFFVASSIMYDKHSLFIYTLHLLCR